ncbi:hypothetical protein CDAR_609781 [Caerostris darwini]|uniref:Uncharacterized protein n=1 Tax=Caerostris darwini TaxID=1538125 RepID=A0AAV4R3X0_9ARAC|nr:hypothetical protein CDAR_609781 [Caerostris darwini]
MTGIAFRNPGHDSDQKFYRIKNGLVMPKRLLDSGRHRLECPFFDLEGMEKRSRATVYQEIVENYCGTMRSILHCSTELKQLVSVIWMHALSSDTPQSQQENFPAHRLIVPLLGFDKKHT